MRLEPSLGSLFYSTLPVFLCTDMKTFVVVVFVFSARKRCVQVFVSRGFFSMESCALFIGFRFRFYSLPSPSALVNRIELTESLLMEVRRRRMSESSVGWLSFLSLSRILMSSGWSLFLVPWVPITGIHLINIGNRPLFKISSYQSQIPQKGTTMLLFLFKSLKYYWVKNKYL